MNWLDFEVKRSKRKVTGKYTNMVEIHWPKTREWKSREKEKYGK